MIRDTVEIYGRSTVLREKQTNMQAHTTVIMYNAL